MYRVCSTALTTTITSIILVTLLAAAWLPAQAQPVPGSGQVFLPMIMRPGGAGTPDSISLELVGQLAEPVQAVAVLDTYLYLGAGSTVVVVDISNPRNPVVVGRSVALSGTITDIAVAPEYVYAAANDLHVLNVSDPANPWPEGFNDTPGPISAVAVAGNFAYATTTQFTPVPEFPTLPPVHTIRVLDISQQDDINEQGIAELPEEAHDLVISGRYAYVADGNGGLRMFDIAASSRPTEVGMFVETGSALGVAINGRHAYVAASVEGILVINITDPPDLRQDNFFPTAESTTGIIVSGEHVYASLSSGGLLALRIAGDPGLTVPLFVEDDFYATPGVITDMATDANSIYVTDSSAGLLILQPVPNTN